MNDKYTFKTEPYAHQHKVFNQSKDKEFFALLMEMRTGKSKVVIDTASFLWQRGKIELLLVVAPNLVHRQWLDTEVERHCPVPWSGAAWLSSWSPNQTERALSQLDETGKLAVFTINYEACISPRGRKILTDLVERSKTLLVLDESHRIKTPSAKQTRMLSNLGKKATYRRILTGTPITQGPFDAFTQFNFLDPSILSCGSYFAFKNRYGVWEKQYAHGRSFQALVEYKNLNDLQQRIAGHSFRVETRECLDLPPRQYSRFRLSLSSKQQHIYNDLRDLLMAELNGVEITAPLALTKLLRLQQVTGGFFPTEDGAVAIDPVCPRMEMLSSILENVPGKVIIWARFRSELEMIEKIFGWSAVTLHGGTKKDERDRNLKWFRHDPEVRYLIANPAVAGEGLDLSVADTMIFYSCSFKLTERLQAEARCDVPGRTTPVTVVDLVAENTIDEHVLEKLHAKSNVAAAITGDELRSGLS